MARHRSARRSLPHDPVHGPWYVRWGARLLVGGPLLGLIVVVAGLVEACNARFVQVAVPGSATVHLDPGAYSIFYEYPEYARPVPVVEFSLVAQATGTGVELLPPEHRETQTVWTRKQVVLYDVDVEEAGGYELAAWYAPGTREATVAVALGRGPQERMLRLLGILAVIGGGAAVWVLIVWRVSRYFHPPRRLR
jgi:hypothetical protein